MSLQALSLTLVALLAGGLIALQAPINAEAASRLQPSGRGCRALVLRRDHGAHCSHAALARHSAQLETLKSLPLYMLIGGGLLGAIYVTVNIMLAPRIGIAALMALGISPGSFSPRS